MTQIEIIFTIIPEDEKRTRTLSALT